LPGLASVFEALLEVLLTVEDSLDGTESARADSRLPNTIAASAARAIECSRLFTAKFLLDYTQKETWRVTGQAPEDRSPARSMRIGRIIASDTTVFVRTFGNNQNVGIDR
jgi:hypothetical protein